MCRYLSSTSGQIETIVREAIVEDTSQTIDSILLGAAAGDAVTPGGLLNGVTPTASAGTTSDNIIADIKALYEAFNTSDSQRALVLIMHPNRRLGVQTSTNALGQQPFSAEVAGGNLLGTPIISSCNVPADSVVAVNTYEFASAGGAPGFSVSQTATLHMEDTSPAPIGDTTVADPLRSLFQTDTTGLRMIMPVTWAMRRDAMVAALSSVAW